LGVEPFKDLEGHPRGDLGEAIADVSWRRVRGEKGRGEERGGERRGRGGKSSGYRKKKFFGNFCFKNLEFTTILGHPIIWKKKRTKISWNFFDKFETLPPQYFRASKFFENKT
jgi:hypothetical protein